MKFVRLLPCALLGALAACSGTQWFGTGTPASAPASPGLAADRPSFARPTAAPPLAADAPPFVIHAGMTQTGDEEPIQVYDTRRALWIAVAQRVPDPASVEISVVGPTGIQPPSLDKPYYLPSTRTFRVKPVFYEPGSGYRVEFRFPDAGGAERVETVDLPPVQPAARVFDTLSFTFVASPSLGIASESALFTLTCRNPDGEPAAAPSTPTYRWVDPCGDGPSGSFAQTASPGVYTLVASPSVTAWYGFYTIRIFPTTAQATFIDFKWEINEAANAGNQPKYR